MIYNQASGSVTFYGLYSGRGAGLNNPQMEMVSCVGPIPRGWYSIEGPFNDPHLGAVVFRLIPDPANEMHGRAGFDLHGDNAEMDHSASEGCIVAPLPLRQAIAASSDRRLQVI